MNKYDRKLQPNRIEIELRPPTTFCVKPQSYYHLDSPTQKHAQMTDEGQRDEQKHDDVVLYTSFLNSLSPKVCPHGHVLSKSFPVVVAASTIFPMIKNSPSTTQSERRQIHNSEIVSTDYWVQTCKWNTFAAVGDLFQAHQASCIYQFSIEKCPYVGVEGFRFSSSCFPIRTQFTVWTEQMSEKLKTVNRGVFGVWPNRPRPTSNIGTTNSI